MTPRKQRTPATARICAGHIHYCLFLPLAIAVLSLIQQSQLSIAFDGSSVPPSDASSGPPSDNYSVPLHDERPQIVWLMSYPNSGTSYTMTLVERASNRSIATNYGVEVTDSKDVSLPVHAQHPEGPFWKGLSGKVGKIRSLPGDLVLTKTHCAGRCVNCPAKEYIVNATTFLKGCERTTARIKKGERRVEMSMNSSRVARLVHLVRNPFHNAVARFHLERRHMVQKKPDMEQVLFNNATGFRAWCRALDKLYADDEEEMVDETTLKLLRQVPCRGEFFKHTQWHNMVTESLPYLAKDIPVLTLHYEDYADNLNATAQSLLEFLELEQVGELRPFRELPTYEDHYSQSDRAAAKALVRAVASDHTWKLVERYFK